MGWSYDVLPPLLGAAKHGYVLGARSSRGVNRLKASRVGLSFHLWKPICTYKHYFSIPR